MLTWVYRYDRKDITKNYTLEESVKLLNEMIGVQFSQADMYCAGHDYFLKTDGKERLTVKESKTAREVAGAHDKTRQRMVEESAAFLHLLEVTSADGHVRKDKKISLSRSINSWSFSRRPCSRLRGRRSRYSTWARGKATSPSPFMIF
ncbi:MAG: hypothetical protein LRY55_05325 [Leadbetterella sp.]|nr:hypothetical protein [Leadbetterella sp.]